MLELSIQAGGLPVGELLEWEVTPKELILRGQAGSLSLSSPVQGVVRLRSGRGGRFAEDRSFAVVADREGKETPAVKETAEVVEADFSGIRLVIGKKALSLAAYDQDGVLLFREYPPGLLFRREGVDLVHLVEPASHYFGLGEKTGPLDKKGRTYTMWNTDMPYHRRWDPMYISIPWLLILREGRAFGLFFDNPCRSRFDLGKSHPRLFRYRVEDGELELYVIAGPAPSEVLRRFTALVGRTPLPPRWALGHQQSRWSYMDEAEVKKIARTFRERDIPCDVIYTDIHYMDRYRVFTFDPARFPDMKRLSAELQGLGFRLVAAVDPGVAAAGDFSLYQEGRERGYFCEREDGGEYQARVWPGKVAFPDFGKPEVQKWWGEAHQVLTDAGISGVWNDMNEPSAWAADLRIKEAVLPFLPIRRPKMVHDDEGRRISHRCFRNVYGLRECQAAYEGLKHLQPDQRPFILSRSGYAGIHRYAAVWTGDNSSSFSHLALSIPMLLNLSLSGVAFAGADIGGFMWNCSPELYARWIQLGSFYPLCRTHTALRTRRQEPWAFGRRVEVIAREYLKLRYRLHPTLYSLFRECHETGAPILRPLFYEFPEDPAAVRIEDQLLFGSHLLLAPVLRKGRRERKVYLPAGTWTDFWTHERIGGPRTILRLAPLEIMPIYVRDGACLFMWPALRWLTERPADRLILKVYPPSEGATEAVLYEDDGVSLRYQEGGFSRRRFHLARENRDLVLLLHEKEGDFSPPARQIIFKIFLDQPAESVHWDGRELPFVEEERGKGQKPSAPEGGEESPLPWPCVYSHPAPFASRCWLMTPAGTSFGCA